MLGATAPSFLKGLGYDRELFRNRSGNGQNRYDDVHCPRQAIRHIGAKRSCWARPTMRGQWIAKVFLEASGVEVVNMKGLSLVDQSVVGRLGPESAYERALQVDCREADAIPPPGVALVHHWQTMDEIERLERRTQEAGDSTSSGEYLGALRILGHTGAVEGYGRLLRELAPETVTQAA